MEGLNGDDGGYRLMAACVFGEDGNPSFTVADVPALKKSSRAAVNALLKAVNRVNGLDVEAAVKNSEAGPGAG